MSATSVLCWIKILIIHQTRLLLLLLLHCVGLNRGDFVRSCLIDGSDKWIFCAMFGVCLVNTGHPSFWHAISWYFDARRPADKNCTMWQIICRRRPTHLEQLASGHSWPDTVSRNICNTAENLLVCLMAAAPVFFELAPEKCTIWYDMMMIQSHAAGKIARFSNPENPFKRCARLASQAQSRLIVMEDVMKLNKICITLSKTVKPIRYRGACDARLQLGLMIKTKRSQMPVKWQ